MAKLTEMVKPPMLVYDKKLGTWVERQKIDRTNLGPMVEGYIECALWAETCGDFFSDKSYSDLGFDVTDITERCLAQMIRDCVHFANQNDWNLIMHLGSKFNKNPKYTERNFGHDFWLSRNGHGAGFFDHKKPQSDNDPTIWDVFQLNAVKTGPCELYLTEWGEIDLLMALGYTEV